MFYGLEIISGSWFFYVVIVFCALSMSVFAVPMRKVEPVRQRVAFYLRYSSHNQRGDSIDDQRRNIIEYLDKMGIAHDNAIEFSDEAISGTRMDRPNFQKLIAMINRGEVDIVVVDDLSRLTRGKDLGMLWDKMRARRCRLISVIDNIDSARESDEIGAMLKGLMNNITNRLNGRRIRRGIAGRVLDNEGSYGAHPYGYETVFSNPEEAAKYSGQGPKPKKRILIKEKEANIIKEVYTLYANGEASLSDIARHLNERQIPMGTRSNRKSTDGVSRYNNGWTKARVRLMLTQRKYIGDWRWGEKYNEHDEQGRRIQHPVNESDVIRSDRPALAIISQNLWDTVQKRLSDLRERFRVKEGQKPRGTQKRHYSEEYPINLTSGLIICGVCGKRMHCIGQGGKYYRCQTSMTGGRHKGLTPCDQNGWVSRDGAQKALFAFLANRLRDHPECMDAIYEETIAAYNRQLKSNPDELALLECQKQQNSKARENIVRAIEGGDFGNMDTLLNRLAQLESDKETIEAKMDVLRRATTRINNLPTLDWVKSQLGDLESILAESGRHAARLLRAYFGEIRAYSIIAPWKQRGHMELRFKPSFKRLVAFMLPLDGMEANDAAIIDEDDIAEEIIVLGTPSKLDQVMPEIDSLRNQGMSWNGIAKKLGVHAIAAKRYHTAYRKVLAEACESKDSDLSSSLEEKE